MRFSSTYPYINALLTPEQAERKTYSEIVYPRFAHFGPVVITTDGVVGAVGLVLSILLAEWCAAHAGVDSKKIYKLCVAMVLSVLALSRIVVFLLYPEGMLHPFLLMTLPKLTAYAPAIAAVTALLAVWLMRMPLLKTLDALAPAALLFATSLHIGDFFIGTDLGARTGLALGTLVRGDEGYHPVALYAACFTALGAAASSFLLKMRVGVGRAFGAALAITAAGHFIADEFRPTYLMPEFAVPGFLRLDQIVLVLLTAGGMMFFLDWRRSDAQ